MQTSTAVFFDGTSSVAYPVHPYADNRLNILVFETHKHAKTEWELSQIRFENYDDILEVRHPLYPAALLKITDPVFINELLTLLDRRGHVGWYHKLLHQSVAFYISATVALLAMAVLGYIYLVPYVAEKSVSLIPESFDHYISQDILTDYIYKNDMDEERSKTLNSFAAAIDFQNSKKLTFSVVNSSQLNAFALPDGNIVVFSGLLNRMESYDELAGLLAHEVVHVNERHGLKMLMRNLAGYLFVSLIFSDVNGIMAVITENAHNLQSLSYSRRFEREADEKAAQILIQNNIDPKGLLQLFERLQELDSKLILPEFMSSHPLTPHRRQIIGDFIGNHDFSIHRNDSLAFIFSELKY
ncbi:MAG: M48 family metallopeptidase [Paludibacteraceae bacterium]|nr:M48 family metallopeptidase [Paludibacteraceae bacterium]